jgi:DNA-binding NarL/FixJ family response regulator
LTSGVGRNPIIPFNKRGITAVAAVERIKVSATGYITKRQAADEIIVAIRRLLAGEVYLSAKTTASFLKSLTTGG